MLKDCAPLLQRDTGEPLHKLMNRGVAFEVPEQRGDRHAGNRGQPQLSNFISLESDGKGADRPSLGSGALEAQRCRALRPRRAGSSAVCALRIVAS